METRIDMASCNGGDIMSIFFPRRQYYFLDLITGELLKTDNKYIAAGYLKYENNIRISKYEYELMLEIEAREIGDLKSS